MMGRVTNTTDTQPAEEFMSEDHGEMFVPAGDAPLRGDSHPAAYPSDSQTEPDSGVAVTDTRSQTEMNPSAQPTTYSQEDIDYAIASRYVELEQEYAKQNKTGKNVAKEISYMVMDDFEMTQQEWEAFLERATASNLFNKVRTEMSSGKSLPCFDKSL